MQNKKPGSPGSLPKPLRKLAVASKRLGWLKQAHSRKPARGQQTEGQQARQTPARRPATPGVFTSSVGQVDGAPVSQDQAAQPDQPDSQEPVQQDQDDEDSP